MAATHNFYLPPEAWRVPFRLEGPEAHHLARVLRLKAGGVVRLFDGLGRHGLFRIDAVSKNAVDLTRQSEQREDRPMARCTGLRRGWAARSMR